MRAWKTSRPQAHRHRLLAARVLVPKLGAAVCMRSGANPNNRNCHWQTNRDGAGNRQGECKKQIYLRAHVIYRHVAYSTARRNRNSHHRYERDDAFHSSRTSLQKEGQWCSKMVNERLTRRVCNVRPLRWRSVRCPRPGRAINLARLGERRPKREQQEYRYLEQ